MAPVKRGRKLVKPEPLSVRPYDVPPSAPGTLGKYGRECWSRVAPLLVVMQWLTPLHLESLEALCDWWHVYFEAKLYLQDNPTKATFATESGYEQRSPVAIARNEAFQNFSALCARFGLTPEALAKLHGRGSGRRGGVPAAEDPAGKVAAFAARKYERPGG